jgi:hypothetical protein
LEALTLAKSELEAKTQGDLLTLSSDFKAAHATLAKRERETQALRAQLDLLRQMKWTARLRSLFNDHLVPPSRANARAIHLIF